ncbi:pilus assembly protein PilP [Limnohabitans sp.]|uniref:pilus assembly protein PilP n=1 Tax=Limnohabitans sp. TaxID=1907725 RepID=UPI00286F5628|nr:pilus assembly protein PilP [Limnohabitans sp.]
MNWRQPWTWPRAYQHALHASAALVGALLFSPWWLTSWQAWDAANTTHDKQLARQQATQALRLQTAHWMKQPHEALPVFADTAALTTLAHQQGLQLSHVEVEPVPNPSWKALQVQQLSVHVKAQGAWDAWRHWLAQWPASAPGVTLSSLTLKADPRGGVVADLVVTAPQATTSEPLHALSLTGAEATAQADPFSTQRWPSTQRTHAAQHPSYARWVAPELARPRDPLEAFARERLQYVGHIETGAQREALVKVLPAAGAKKDASMMSVYRLRVNGHLGHDFGRLLAIAPDHLQVQELVLMPTGEWQPREVRLPLQETLP